MTRRSKLWRILASLFTLLNLGGAIFAAAIGEGLHAGVHVALALVGAYLVWRLAPRSDRQAPADEQPTDDRLDQLQQSVDAVAIEVERIGEAPRFSTRLEADRADVRR